MSRARSDQGARNQYGPKDWIAAASRVLVNRSVDAIGIESLAKELGVTKGSFYWHFKDREDLLRRMLTSWRDAATEQIIFRFESRNLPARELIRDLLSLPFRGAAAKDAASIELAIRAWGRRDDMARSMVNEVDGKRLSYIAQCFSALGFGIAEARARGFLLYSYELSESILEEQGTESQIAERRAFVESLFLGARETEDRPAPVTPARQRQK
ncbi:TetR family transcriptional regulator [Paraburkholderia sp. BL27I4N3]|uniref:TetR/AcrR family transcriptional regulator n=1 Tax=Paraburkholderia sp. BL27I4N3 TaxID=1938805 RepID=UPI000E232896|nr:TetR/AcrR family transcriptional regulator [Paraburkholderia sp. BL27I4N3]REE06603.1 TetR family transcriptional regulator [Paraburkholderia sp. BL27I4N3]